MYARKAKNTGPAATASTGQSCASINSTIVTASAAPTKYVGLSRNSVICHARGIGRRVTIGVRTCAITTRTRQYAATAPAIGSAWFGHSNAATVPPSAWYTSTAAAVAATAAIPLATRRLAAAATRLTAAAASGPSASSAASSTTNDGGIAPRSSAGRYIWPSTNRQTADQRRRRLSAYGSA